MSFLVQEDKLLIYGIKFWYMGLIYSQGVWTFVKQCLYRVAFRNLLPHIKHSTLWYYSWSWGKHSLIFALYHIY